VSHIKPTGLSCQGAYSAPVSKSGVTKIPSLMVIFTRVGITGLSVSEPPKSEWVRCPECNAQAVALIPRDSTTVEDKDESDGKARVNCPECGNHFLVLFKSRTQYCCTDPLIGFNSR